MPKEDVSVNTQWYDQPENEWVIFLSDYGVIEYANGDETTLKQGGYLHVKVL